MNPLICASPPGVTDFERAGRDSPVAFISLDGGRYPGAMDVQTDHSTTAKIIVIIANPVGHFG